MKSGTVYWQKRGQVKLSRRILCRLTFYPAPNVPRKQDIRAAAPNFPVMLTNEETLQIFKDSGALLEGHFLLASGYHSAIYLEKFQVLQFPPMVEKLCAEIAGRFANAEVEVVIGPTTGGVLLAYEVAKHLGVRGIFAERGDDGLGRVLRRGFEIKEGENVLLVDDILTTGGSVRDTMQVVEGYQGNLVGIGVLGRPLRRHGRLRRSVRSPAAPRCRKVRSRRPPRLARRHSPNRARQHQALEAITIISVLRRYNLDDQTVSELKKLYRSRPIAQAFFDLAAQRKNDSQEVTVERALDSLENRFDRGKVVDLIQAFAGTWLWHIRSRQAHSPLTFCLGGQHDRRWQSGYRRNIRNSRNKRNR